jgi:Ca-activated chloride channel family protein
MSMKLHPIFKSSLIQGVLLAAVLWPHQALGQTKRVEAERAPVAEQSEGTIKISTEMVQVAFAVVDPQNHLVRDLRSAEVQLYDDGRLQKLELFRLSNSIPMVLAILIDKSASQEAVLNYEKNAIDVFLDAYFRPGIDYCSLLTFQWKLTLSTGLTNNLRQLKSGLRSIEREQVFRDEEGGVPLLGTGLYDALINTARETLAGQTARLITGETGPGSTQVTEENIQRKAIRRAVVILTDGVDTASQSSIEDVIRLYQRHGIAIYALGIGDLSRQRQVNQRVLERLTRETGGMAFYPAQEEEIESHFKKVVETLSSLYLVAYYPTGVEEGKQFRRIEIKLPTRPANQVIHRIGYQVEEK